MREIMKVGKHVCKHKETRYVALLAHKWSIRTSLRSALSFRLLISQIYYPRYLTNQSVLSDRTIPKECHAYDVVRENEHQQISYCLPSNTTMSPGHRLSPQKSDLGPTDLLRFLAFSFGSTLSISSLTQIYM